MSRATIFIAAAFAAATAGASWYWPFGGDGEPEKPRMSELMEPASLLIDDATDLADDGKIAEAVEKYQQAFAELERLEIENPERAATSEFSTVRNKKAYINAAIDSLLLKQARDNAKAVAVTDTTELEKRYASYLAAKAEEKTVTKPKTGSDRGEKDAAEGDNGDGMVGRLVPKPPQENATENGALGAKRPTNVVENGALGAKRPTGKAPTNAAPRPAVDPASRKGRIMQANADVAKKDYDAAMLTVKALLAEKPNDAAALNLRAVIEAAQGRTDAAEATLGQAIQSNPRNHYAYYNLAKLILQTRGDAGKDTARRYYENGREYCGGPVDKKLEEKLK